MESASARLFAPVLRPGPETDESPYVLPPFPPADVVLILGDGKGNFFLYKVSRRGEFAGDTWHQSIDDAKEQAICDYGDLLGRWSFIPDDVDDPIGYAIESIDGSIV